MVGQFARKIEHLNRCVCVLWCAQIDLKMAPLMTAAVIFLFFYFNFELEQKLHCRKNLGQFNT